MSRIHFTRRHRLGVDEARVRISEVAQRLEREFHVACRWQGNRLSFKRSGVSGRIDVGEDAVTLDVHLGLFLLPMRQTIANRIDDKLTHVLS
ncbi:putative polyhydroxyalkanoic acid system protein [Thioflavicoccus mobilis 8321]|uniref:Putative polyhydroxyalkanoic acid system protein n=1 Tax=Thioflavicoccus mobilis 8321 TaxID=765912 RepID=L0GYL2_9GAMM|nr:polyhydroxyalkanoic acid system family protein [Thioflavicoccus mobilis]AGA90404.1 putative polyhydroxyalkanoic acid system protein [Thioflavicoccus mobilis 8321]